MKKQKTYNVLIDMKWSIDYTIKAESIAEAKRKAWNKFKQNPQKKLFELIVE